MINGLVSKTEELLQMLREGSVRLDEFDFLKPEEIGILTISCKLDNSIIDPEHISGRGATFLSRVNFYNTVRLEDTFNLDIFYGNNNNTIELHSANTVDHDIDYRLGEILKNEPIENKNAADALITELMANVEFYADFGYVVGQVIDKRLYLSVVDKGPGIVAHLRKHIDRYEELSDDEVLRQSTEKGVTSGRGRGYGLWQAREIIRKNGGVLSIRTGNQVLDAVTGQIYNSNFPWLGTSVLLVYNLDNPSGVVNTEENSSGDYDDLFF